jgi:hypothetical protein
VAPVPLPEDLARARHGPLVHREVDARIGHVRQDQRVGSGRGDAIGTLQGVLAEDLRDPVEPGATAGHLVDDRHEAADQLSRKTVGPDGHHEERPLHSDGRLQVPEGPGLVGCQVVEVVLAGDPIEHFAGAGRSRRRNPLGTDGLVCRTGSTVVGTDGSVLGIGRTDVVIVDTVIEIGDTVLAGGRVEVIAVLPSDRVVRRA